MRVLPGVLIGAALTAFLAAMILPTIAFVLPVAATAVAPLPGGSRRAQRSAQQKMVPGPAK